MPRWRHELRKTWTLPARSRHRITDSSPIPETKEIPRVRDLALVADKQPGPREEPLQLFLIDLLVDKDLAADLPRPQIHETRAIPLFTHHRLSSPKNHLE